MIYMITSKDRLRLSNDDYKFIREEMNKRGYDIPVNIQDTYGRDIWIYEHRNGEFEINVRYYVKEKQN